MTKKLSHFHLVQMSPWPLFNSLGALNLMSSFILWVTFGGLEYVLLSLTTIFFLSGVWWQDVERETSYNGEHSNSVKLGLKLGMLLFITSEVMFFLSFFWSFLHGSSSSDLELGSNWPPSDVHTFDPLSVPLVNTIVLLSSGASVTWCHHLILKNSLNKAMFSLFVTVLLGVFFSFLQSIEYISSPFSVVDSILGSTFFLATGFHGTHVLVGTTFLMVVFLKLGFFLNTKYQNIGFECSAWYWHFVDVVWLFLYSLVYWWGG